MTRVAGLLLTGGRSRRMGVDKATLALDGVTLAERAADVLGSVCDPLLEVGAGRSALPTVREDPPGAGPLAALAAGGEELARRGYRGAVVLLAVDLPAMTRPFLELVRDWPGAPTAVPARRGRLQPVCARYGADALVAAGSLLAGGVASLHALLDVVEHDVIAEPRWRTVAAPDTLDDVDTPEDARRFGVDLGARAR